MSLQSDSNIAVDEALEEAMGDLAGTATVAILFATSHHSNSFPEIIQTVRKRTQVRALFGATGAGVVGPKGEVELSPALSILVLASDRITAAATLIPRIDAPDAVDLLRGELPSLYRERGTLMMMIDPKSMHPDFLGRIAQTFPETPIIGAAAGWCASDHTAALAADGDSADRGCTALHLAGCIEPAIGVAQAVLPEGAARPITRAKGNTILQIDSKPAAEFLSAFVQQIRHEQPEQAPLDIYCTIADSPFDFEAGRYIVRNILAVEPATKHMTIAEPVMAGQYVCFGLRSPKGARRSYRLMLERLNSALSGRVPRAAVVFNCCARGQSLYGRPHVDLDAYREFFPELPIVGLFGFAEIGPISWEGRKVRSAILNHTAVLSLLTEPMVALGTA